MFKRLKEMKVMVHILTSLAVCTGIPAICNFVFVYGHGYSQFDCLTEILLVCPTLKPPTIWQLGKNNLDSCGGLWVASDTSKSSNCNF
jgi:hypothetical protein